MKNYLRVAGALFGAAAIGIAGCGDGVDSVDTTGPATNDGEEKSFVGGKGDAWNRLNDPAGFRTELVYAFDELPDEGASSKIAWADDYWPTYADGINRRWQGVEVLSPAEKYDKAFNDWEPVEGFMDLKPYRGFDSRHYSQDDGCDWDKEYYRNLGPAANWVSENKGNKSARKHRDDVAEGERCGFDEEAKDLNGIETWWGLCHAWVPASMLEDEPLKPVTRNGVTFEVADIKALLQMEYDRIQSYFIGQRCNAREVERDEVTNRATDESCRNLNAGTFHVIMTNFLGIQKRMIAADIDPGYMVWNHPLTGYTITSSREVTLEQANELLRLEGDENAEQYKYNDRAERFYEVQMTYEFITESAALTTPTLDDIQRYTRRRHMHYLVELDGEGDVIGGEWLGDSLTSHPDFLWLPIRAVGSNPYVDLHTVREMVAESRSHLGEDDYRVVTVESNESVAIPDNDPNGVVSTIDVRESGSLKGLTIDLEIRHTYRGDLRVELRKDNVGAVVFNGLGRNLERPWEDDVILTGEVVNGFEGLDAEGIWTLHVIDGMAADTGHIVSWSLNLEM